MSPLVLNTGQINIEAVDCTLQRTNCSMRKEFYLHSCHKAFTKLPVYTEGHQKGLIKWTRFTLFRNRSIKIK